MDVFQNWEYMQIVSSRTELLLVQTYGTVCLSWNLHIKQDVIDMIQTLASQKIFPEFFENCTRILGINSHPHHVC